MQGRKLGERLDTAKGAGVDHNRNGQLLATVDYPVADRPKRPVPPDRGLQGCHVQLSGALFHELGADELVARAEYRQLQAARAGIDDQQPGVLLWHLAGDQNPQVQFFTSGTSSPSSRVYA